MSWVVEEWKEGLSPRVLQKIQELESQVDKLKKERQQRQFQLESLEVALEKQKQKVMEILRLDGRLAEHPLAWPSPVPAPCRSLGSCHCPQRAELSACPPLPS
uniref:Centromere protein Cenp-F N-terminal domain-containing protein n=1 Tax=Anas platyrhynchos platyrhynchos TaxID=8840 RepID=A0A493T1L5_ANAPP